MRGPNLRLDVRGSEPEWAPALVRDGHVWWEGKGPAALRPGQGAKETGGGCHVRPPVGGTIRGGAKACLGANQASPTFTEPAHMALHAALGELQLGAAVGTGAGQHRLLVLDHLELLAARL